MAQSCAVVPHMREEDGMMGIQFAESVSKGLRMKLYWIAIVRQILAILLIYAQPLWMPAAEANEPVTIGGGFTLNSPDGHTVTDQSYLGKWMLVYFGYTSCPDSCPTTLMVMAAVLKELGPEADKLQTIFITIDPERDTPKILEEYTQSFDPRIIGLTGSQHEIDAVSRAYGAFSVRRSTGPDASNYLVEHSTYIYLMSPQGKFVRAFDADASSDTITSALRNMIAQSYEDGSEKQMAHKKHERVQ